MSAWKSFLAVAVVGIVTGVTGVTAGFSGVAAAQPAAEPSAGTAPQAPAAEPVPAPGNAAAGEPIEMTQEPAGHPIEPGEIDSAPSRASGFWTSRRPAKGGAYRYRLLGIGVVILLATLGMMIWVVRRYNRADRT